MERHEQEAVCRKYGLGNPLECRSLGGTRNRNYALQTGTGKWFVRQRYSGYCDPARMAFDNEALHFLSARGVAVIPPSETIADKASRPVHTSTTKGRDGPSPFWRDVQGRVWQVFPFVDGLHFREGSPTDADALGKALALFHEKGKTFPLRCDKLGPRGETDPVIIQEHADRIERESSECHQTLRLYRTWIADAARDLPDDLYVALPHTLIHGDIQPANILMADNVVAALIDLDWCAWRPRIYDLAFGLSFCCATHETPICGEDIWSLTQPPRTDDGLACTFLSAYQAGASGLCEEELTALRAQVILGWCHSRIAGALKVPADERATFLSRPPDNLDPLLPSFLIP